MLLKVLFRGALEGAVLLKGLFRGALEGDVVAGWASAVGEDPAGGLVPGLRGFGGPRGGRRTRGRRAVLPLLLLDQLVRTGALAARLGAGDEGLAVDGPLPAKVQVGVPGDRSWLLAKALRHGHKISASSSFTD